MLSSGVSTALALSCLSNGLRAKAHSTYTLTFMRTSDFAIPGLYASKANGLGHSHYQLYAASALLFCLATHYIPGLNQIKRYY